ADDYVHCAGTQVPDDALLLATGAETGEQFDAHRIIRHSLAERVEMLLRQHRGGHEYRDLAAVHHRFERGANRDLGLAEADIATDQAVHRLGFFQVRFGFPDGTELVRRLLVNECTLKLPLPRRVGGKSVAWLQFARGLDREELTGKV